jgi:hypothetical protein
VTIFSLRNVRAFTEMAEQSIIFSAAARLLAHAETAPPPHT